MKTRTMMSMMGAGMAMGATYYMMLPKDKKNDIKNKAKKMIDADKDFMSSISM